MAKWRERLRIMWDLYRHVRLWLGVYVLLVVAGTITEGLALAAIVPLVEGSGGNGFGGIHGEIIEFIGLDSTSEVSLVMVVGALFVLRSANQYGAKLIAGLMTRREAVRLRVEMFQLYLGLRWETAVGITQGEINLLLGTQVQKVAQFLQQMVTLGEGMIYAVGLTTVAVVLSPQNTVVAVALIGSTTVAVVFIANLVRMYAAKILASSKLEAGLMLQYARGIQMLRAYDVTEDATREIEDFAWKREQLGFRSHRVQALAQVVPDLLFVLALLAVVAIALDSGEGLASIGAVVALLFRVSQYLKRFSDFGTLSQMIPTIQDVHRFRQLFLREQSPNVDMIVDPGLAPGELVIEGLTYRYRGSSTAALDHVTNHIAPGEFIGVVGSSGSGKSTLVSAIVGLLEPQEGEVRVGLSDRRERGRPIAYVPQSPFILRGTIASNVRWFRDLEDAAVRSACSDAGLDPLLSRLPHGIHTSVGQEGLTLSGGERQRVAVARALAADPQILVLDEATSALDSESEAAIQRALDQLHGNITVIAVAHRLSTVLSADRIWVLEAGTITEDAPAQELLRTKGSRFAQLGALQGLVSDGIDERRQ